MTSSFTRLTAVVLVSGFLISSPLMVFAGPSHDEHEHGAEVSDTPTNSRHDHHHDAKQHEAGMETSYGMPGDPSRPSRDVKITMLETDDGMAFVPNNIRVTKGEQIKFSVTNAGELDHKIVIATEEENDKHAEMMKKEPHMAHDDPNALRLAPGKSGSFTWHFTRAGVFDMSCLIPGHKEAGMTGLVRVE